MPLDLLQKLPITLFLVLAALARLCFIARSLTCCGCEFELNPMQERLPSPLGRVLNVSLEVVVVVAAVVVVGDFVFVVFAAFFSAIFVAASLFVSSLCFSLISLLACWLSLYLARASRPFSVDKSNSISSSEDE